MSHIAECPECSKKYKVPHLDKAWQCKVCNVPLSLPDSEQREQEGVVAPDRKKAQGRADLERSTCPACGATVPGRRRECRECGESLVSDPYASPVNAGRPEHKRAPTGGTQSMVESAARGAAKKELRKLGFLRFLVMFGLFTSCFELIGDVMALSSSAEVLWPAVDLGVDIIVVWFLWSTHKALATIYGRPRPFVLILACLYTLAALSSDVLFIQVISGLYALMYWMFVGTLGKIEAIKAEMPGAFADPDPVRSVGAEEKMHRRRVSGEPRKCRDTGAAKDRNRLLLILGGIGIALLVGVVGYKAMSKLPLPDQVMAEFRTEWNAGDFEGVAALAAVDRQST